MLENIVLSVMTQGVANGTVEPRFNEVTGDRPNLFVKWRVRYIEVLFHTFYCNFGRDIEIISFVISRTLLNGGSLNRGSTVPRKLQVSETFHSISKSRNGICDELKVSF